MKSSVLWLALAATLAGCESVVTVTPPAHTPRLSLAYTLSTQPQSADYQENYRDRNPFASTSQAILVNKNLAGRTDAAIELRDASGQVVETFRPDTSRYSQKTTDYRYGAYLPVRGYAGVPGQAYTLRASAPGVEAVQATLTMPALPTIEGASFVQQPVPAAGGSGFIYDYYGVLSFAIPDQSATTDYYVAYARVLDATGAPWGYAYQDDDIRNSDGPTIDLNQFRLSYIGNVNSIKPISDAGRNGQRLLYSNAVGLSYSRPYNPANPGRPRPGYLEVTVSAIPASSYDFYQSLQRYRSANDNPFAEPAPLRSNVEGGYGLFGGASDRVVRIKL
jgi:hypothetical protein